MFQKATKQQQKLRLLLEGASGSGKTYSALILATALGKKVAFIDTEFGSASLYSDKFNFDVLNLEPPYTPESYIDAIKAAEKAGYDVVVIDSISHEWSGQGGCLDIHTQLGGKFQDWGKITPRHKKFIDSILQAKIHVIACARAKSDYEMNSENGRVKVEKVGLKTEQREGLDFEFTIVFRLNQKHMATATKDRTSIFDGLDFVITEETANKISSWLQDGEEPRDHAAELKAYLIKNGINDVRDFCLFAKITKGNMESFIDDAGALEMLVEGYKARTEVA